MFRELLKEFIAVPILRDVSNKETVIVKRYCHTELFSFPQLIIIQLKIRINCRMILRVLNIMRLWLIWLLVKGSSTLPLQISQPFTVIHWFWSWRGKSCLPTCFIPDFDIAYPQHDKSVHFNKFSRTQHPYLHMNESYTNSDVGTQILTSFNHQHWFQLIIIVEPLHQNIVGAGMGTWKIKT